MLSRGLAGATLIVGVGVACVAAAARPARPIPPPHSAPVPASPAADEIVTRTNAQRVSLKLSPLLRSGALMRAAQLHADQMAAANRMAHELPGSMYPSLDSRLDAVGYRIRAAGENVAEGYPSSAAVVAGWMTSPGHRGNIVSTRYTEMGGGVTIAKNGRRFYVQVFASPR